MGNNVYLIILCLFVLIFFGVSMNVSKRDLANPCVGTLGLFSISIIFAIAGNFSWGNNFSWNSMCILMLCCFTILIVFILCSKIAIKRKRYTEKEISRIDITVWKKNLLIIIAVILTVGYVYDVIKQGRLLAITNSDFIYQTKISNSEGNFFWKQGIKVVMALAYVDSFVFVNNILSTSKKKEDWLLIIPTICGSVCSIFTGVRTEIYRLIIAIAIYFFVLFREKNKWKKYKIMDSKTKKRLFLILSAFCGLFFVMRNYIKAADIGENQSYGFLMYLAFYVGSPWIVINNKIIAGLDTFKGRLFGEVTFSNMYLDLIDMGILHRNTQIKGQAFASIDPQNSVNGNADTIFGQPLVDFGVWGTIVFLVILFTFLSRFYLKNIKNTYGDYYRNRKLIIYAFLYYIVGLAFYSNVLSLMISIYYFITLILILLIYFFYFGRIKKMKGTSGFKKNTV